MCGLGPERLRRGERRCRSSDSRGLGGEDDELIVVEAEVSQRCRIAWDLLVDFQCNLEVLILVVVAIVGSDFSDTYFLNMRVSGEQRVVVREAGEGRGGESCHQ